MKTSEVYSHYNIPPNLQEHMYRVAGVIVVILDSWESTPLPNRDILIRAGLLHDMGNLVKFTWGPSTLHFLGKEAERMEFWQQAQKDFMQKYGNDEYTATRAVVKEMGYGAELLDIIGTSWFEILGGLEKATTEQKIFLYADMRVGPLGVISLQHRLDDIYERYVKDKTKFRPMSHEEVVRRGHLLEENLMSHLSITPKDINDFTVNSNDESLVQIQLTS